VAVKSGAGLPIIWDMDCASWGSFAALSR